nr:hypothetical protein [Micromonospora sp. DSM 115978]
YPNWRLPVVDAGGRPVTVERLVEDPAVGRLAAVLATVRQPDLRPEPDPEPGAALEPPTKSRADT